MPCFSSAVCHKYPPYSPRNTEHIPQFSIHFHCFILVIVYDIRWQKEIYYYALTELTQKNFVVLDERHEEEL